jgi:tetratricopeptide (TPR) repeat protein
MQHVFISYKHDEDSVFAELLIHKIKDAGFETWRDHDQIQPGEDWRTEIDQAIKSSLALVVIMTPAAKTSEYITYEWAFALGVGIRVIPVLHKKTELHPRLKILQFLDFTNWKSFPWFSLIKTLKKIGQQKKEEQLEAGKIFLEHKEYEKALEASEEAIHLDPDCPRAWNTKGCALYSLKKYEEALKASEKAIRLDPDYARAWNTKGCALYGLNRYEKVLAACETAIQLDPELALAWNTKSYALYDLKKYEEALKASEEAIRLDPKYALAWNTKSRALYSLKRYEAALKASEEAIRLDPNYALTWKNKGNALKALGRENEARQCYEKARQLGYKG